MFSDARQDDRADGINFTHRARRPEQIRHRFVKVMSMCDAYCGATEQELRAKRSTWLFSERHERILIRLRLNLNVFRLFSFFFR